eukprot:44669-Eustigmatos_ZCMA.PRE.1
MPSIELANRSCGDAGLDPAEGVHKVVQADGPQLLLLDRTQISPCHVSQRPHRCLLTQRGQITV